MPKKKEEPKINWTDVYGSKKPEGDNFTDKETILRFRLNKAKTLKQVKRED